MLAKFVYNYDAEKGKKAFLCKPFLSNSEDNIGGTPAPPHRDRFKHVTTKNTHCFVFINRNNI